MCESALIEKFFHCPNTVDKNIITGIGDDAAVLTIPIGQQLVISMDTLNKDIHFPAVTTAFDIGYKTAAVNLSDLAAMGALPKWATLSLSLPQLDQQWLSEFSNGLFKALTTDKVSLVGGDLNRGSLSTTLQIHGLVPTGAAILRSTAKPGDLLYVSGTLGDAALALQAINKEINLSKAAFRQILPALNIPQPQVALGLALRNIATAMIDISDGLINDLPRILTASHCGAQIDLAALPISLVLRDSLLGQAAYQHAFVGGDDYQLCFTVPRTAAPQMVQLSQQLGVSLTQIGTLNNNMECTLLNSMLSYAELKENAFQHF